MRRLARSLTALMFAGTAVLAVAAPASANGPLVNVVVEDVGNGNQITVLQNVSVAAAAAACNINVLVLANQLIKDGYGKCPAETTVDQIGKVILL